MGTKKKKKPLSSKKKAVKKTKSVKGLRGPVLKSSQSSIGSKTAKNSKSKKKSSKVSKKKAVSSSVKAVKKKKAVSQLKRGKNIKPAGKMRINIVRGKKKKPVVGKKEGIKKEVKTQENMEKRKILELKKELENLNQKKEEDVLIKDTEGRLFCHDENCDQPAVTDIYCRYHYLALWKYLQTRKKLLDEKYLFNTIHELIRSFGEGALYFALRDFKNEKAFEIATREMSFSTGKEEDIITSEVDTNF